jgi:four helix bundle protein
MARFVQIAMGSGAELSYHLLLTRDLRLLHGNDYAELNAHLERVMRMLSALSERLQNARSMKGLKPKAKSQEPIASIS